VLDARLRRQGRGRRQQHQRRKGDREWRHGVGVVTAAPSKDRVVVEGAQQ
jgi:hypothetical protein